MNISKQYERDYSVLIIILVICGGSGCGWIGGHFWEEHQGNKTSPEKITLMISDDKETFTEQKGDTIGKEHQEKITLMISDEKETFTERKVDTIDIVKIGKVDKTYIPDTDISEKLPEALYDVGRIKVAPADGGAAALNPPNFLWPRDQDTKTEYYLELSRKQTFSGKDVIRTKKKRGCLAIVHQKLNSGKWYWRYNKSHISKSEWSQGYSFTITDKTPVFVTPDINVLINSLPKERPYMLSFGVPHSTVMENAKRFPELAKEIINVGKNRRRQKIINFDTWEDKSKYTPRNLGRIKMKQGRLLTDLCKAYLVTGDKSYYHAAEKRIREMLKWDHSSGMEGADLNRQFAQAYDTFYNLLPADLKKKFLKINSDFLKKYFDRWPGRVEAKQIDNHFWQKELSGFFETALATVADLPENEKYLEYAYDAFIARSPVVGGNDGGWANGIPYFGVNNSTVGSMAYVLQKICKVDIFNKPWYKNMGDYFIYSAPAGGPMDGFGDMHDRCGKGGGGAYLCTLLAIEKQDPKALYQLSRLKKGDMKIVDPWLQLINGIPSLEKDETFPPDQLPQARQFREVGLVPMHTDIGDAENDLALYFRSSPYGGNGHMHGNQNCFNLSYKGQKIFYSTGYYTSFSDSHSISSYKHTRAHNGILINGKGQAFGHEGYGWIKRFAHGNQISYTCGDASKAYRPVVNKQWSNEIKGRLDNKGIDSSKHFGDAKLKKFERHVTMLRPNTVVIYDILEAKEPADWELLLHTYKESVKGKNNELIYELPGIKAEAKVFASDPIDMSISDQFAVKPVDFLKKYGKIPNQYHASWKSDKKCRKMRYLTIIQVNDSDKPAAPVNKIDPENFTVGEWQIQANLNTAENPLLSITGKNAELHVNALPNSVFGKTVTMPGKQATLLAEKVNGEVTMTITENKPPLLAE